MSYLEQTILKRELSIVHDSKKCDNFIERPDVKASATALALDTNI